MITDISKSTLESIHNPVLRSYAAQYVDIYEDFRQQVRQMGMDFAEQDNSEQVRDRTHALGKKGAVVRKDGKSVYVNRRELKLNVTAPEVFKLSDV